MPLPMMTTSAVSVMRGHIPDSQKFVSFRANSSGILQHTKYKAMMIHAKSLRLVSGVLLMLASSIVCAAQENKRLEYAILIDSTGSMRSQFAEVLRLGKAVVHRVHDHGPVSIFNFRSEFGRSSRAIPTLRIERSQDENALDRTIDNLYVEVGQTTLLDAVDAMAEGLDKTPAAVATGMIMITDGEIRVSEKNQ